MGVGRGRSILATLVLGLVALPVPSILAAAPAAAAATPIKIMPLGDSITLGSHDGNTSANGGNGGYRIRLEDLLVAGGYSFDFVGTQPPSGPSSLADKNHEGHGGFTIQRIRDNIFTYLNKAPDVVLLMIGANDIGLMQDLANAPARLQNLITTILNNSSARVIVAKVTPWKDVKRDSNGGKCDPGDNCINDFFKPQQNATVTFNNAIPGIVSRHSARVSMVDMFTGFSRDTSPTWLDDEQHPNRTGYDQVAGRWYPELKRVLDSMPTATVPGKPTGVSATAGNAKATVTFTPPASDGGSPITGYAVTASAGGGTRLTTTSPYVFTGLTNGTSYTFTVKAANAVGAGPASNPSNAVTPTGAAPTAPGAPTIGTAVAGNARATVNFTPPASNGGSTITSYTVTASAGGGSKVATASPFVFTGLANGTAYTFTVKATNTAGTGPPSGASNSVTPVATPPPTGTTYLSDLTATKTDVGQFQRDKNANGSVPVNAGTQTFAKGLGVNPPVTLTYALNGGYTRFLSDVGISKTLCGAGGTATFKVFLGSASTPVFTSGTMNGNSPVQRVDVDVTGVTTLKLVYEKTGTSGCNYGAWADARLTP